MIAEHPRIKCPTCGAEGEMLNIHKFHLMVCRLDGIYWCLGVGLLDDWQIEDKADWLRNIELLKEYEPHDVEDFICLSEACWDVSNLNANKLQPSPAMLPFLEREILRRRRERGL